MNHPLYFPLTFSQQSIWDIQTFYGNSSYVNLAVGVIIQDELDIDVLQKAININILRNEAIRLRFVMIDGEPRQYISEFREYQLDQLDFSHSEGLKEFKDWKDHQTRIIYKHLDRDLFYIAYVKLFNSQAALYFKFHHLISDAWSLNMIINDVLNTYKALVNHESFLTEQKPSYLSYILDDMDYCNSLKYKERGVFWEKLFETMPEFTLFDERTRGKRDSQAKRRTITMSSNLCEKVKQFSARHNSSGFIIFFAVFALYLSKVTAKHDIVIGTPVLNRSNHQQRNTAGMFISNIPFRITIDLEWDFLSYLNHISKSWRLLLKNQRYPYKGKPVGKVHV